MIPKPYDKHRQMCFVLSTGISDCVFFLPLEAELKLPQLRELPLGVHQKDGLLPLPALYQPAATTSTAVTTPRAGGRAGAGGADTQQAEVANDSKSLPQVNLN